MLVIPERVVEFRGDETFVQVEDAGTIRETKIELGLSDGLTAEVLSGLNEGDRVLERN